MKTSSVFSPTLRIILLAGNGSGQNMKLLYGTAMISSNKTWIKQPIGLKVSSFALWVQNQCYNVSNSKGWHRGLDSTLGLKHPGVFEFIKSLQKIQLTTSFIKDQLDSGKVPKKGRQCYQEIKQSLKNLVNDFQPNDVVQFLKGCANNIYN